MVISNPAKRNWWISGIVVFTILTAVALVLLLKGDVHMWWLFGAGFVGLTASIVRTSLYCHAIRNGNYFGKVLWSRMP